MNVAVLVAAGSSSRMKMSERKPFLELEGRAVIEWTCAAFAEAREIDEIVIVARGDDVERLRALAASSDHMSSVSAVVPGGAERADSVRAGVDALAANVELIAIHDAARPLVTAEEIDRVISVARERGAALLALPVTDTIKTSSDGIHAEATLDRSVLWRAQTPQAFRTTILRELLNKAITEDFRPTDDAALYERYVGAVPIVEGLGPNLKLTTPEDLELATAILQRRAQGA